MKSTKKPEKIEKCLLTFQTADYGWITAAGSLVLNVVLGVKVAYTFIKEKLAAFRRNSVEAEPKKKAKKDRKRTSSRKSDDEDGENTSGSGVAKASDGVTAAGDGVTNGGDPDAEKSKIEIPAFHKTPPTPPPRSYVPNQEAYNPCYYNPDNYNYNANNYNPNNYEGQPRFSQNYVSPPPSYGFGFGNFLNSTNLLKSLFLTTTLA